MKNLRLLLFIQFDFSFEGDGCGTSHEDVVVGGVPFDVEGATIHLNVALTTCPACEMGGDSSGAGSSATSESNARTAFPHTHTESVIVDDLNKFYVAALGKEGVVLQKGTVV